MIVDAIFICTAHARPRVLTRQTRVNSSSPPKGHTHAHTHAHAHAHTRTCSYARDAALALRQRHAYAGAFGAYVSVGSPHMGHPAAPVGARCCRFAGVWWGSGGGVEWGGV